MSKSILKYNVLGRGVVSLQMPIGAKVLFVSSQHDVPTLWAEADLSAATEGRTFQSIHTGFDLVPDGIYIGTALMDTGRYVSHVYEIAKAEGKQ